MKTEVKTKDLLAYIQDLFTEYLEDRERYGNNPREEHRLQQLLGMKDMVENLIGEPVNLRKDGRVTTGF